MQLHIHEEIIQRLFLWTLQVEKEHALDHFFPTAANLANSHKLCKSGMQLNEINNFYYYYYY